jgi:hypothetical protein
VDRPGVASRPVPTVVLRCDFLFDGGTRVSVSGPDPPPFGRRALLLLTAAGLSSFAWAGWASRVVSPATSQFSQLVADVLPIGGPIIRDANACRIEWNVHSCSPASFAATSKPRPVAFRWASVRGAQTRFQLQISMSGLLSRGPNLRTPQVIPRAAACCAFRSCGPLSRWTRTGSSTRPVTFNCSSSMTPSKCKEVIPRGAPKMEPLWSRGVANGGKASALRRPRKRLQQAKTFATGCHRLRPGQHGKEGVNGSSPLEGSQKAPEIRGFSLGLLCRLTNTLCHGSSCGTLRFQCPSAATALLSTAGVEPFPKPRAEVRFLSGASTANPPPKRAEGHWDPDAAVAESCPPQDVYREQ